MRTGGVFARVAACLKGQYGPPPLLLGIEAEALARSRSTEE
jgi:hypothetical protein